MSFKAARSGQLHLQILRLRMSIAHWEAPTADFVWSMCFDDSGRSSFVGYVADTLGMWVMAFQHLKPWNVSS